MSKKVFVKYDRKLIHSIRPEVLSYRPDRKKLFYIYHFKFLYKDFERYYEVPRNFKLKIKDHEKLLFEKVEVDYNNGNIKKQVEGYYDQGLINLEKKKKKNKKKALLLLALLLFVGGGAGGALYALKDVIWGGGVEPLRKYNVTYNCLGGTIQGEEKKVISEQSRIQTAPYPDRVGYKFVGWYEDITYKKPVSFPATIDSDVTYYAKYVREGEIESFIVDFNTGDESCEIDSIKVIRGKTLEDYGKLATPTKEDYKFVGWYYDEACTDPVDLKKTVTSNFTLYAKYTQNAFTVTFNTNGGTSPSGAFNNKISHLSNLSVEPYTEQKSKTIAGEYLPFLGWKKEDGTPVPYPFKIEKDQTLTAEWGAEGDKTHVVNFFKDDTSIIPFKTLSHEHHIATLPTEKQIPNADPNYKITGWYRKATTPEKIENGYIIPDNLEAIELYPTWEKITHTVNLFIVKDGVVSSDPIEKRTCAVINIEPSFVVQDYEFRSWHTDEKCESPTVNFNDGVTITEDCNFYAKYEKTCFDVEYLDESGTKVSSASHVSKISRTDLPNLKKTNHKVIWTIKNKKGEWEDIDFSEGKSIVVKDWLEDGKTTLSLKARWEQNAHNLTLRYPTIDTSLVHEDKILTDQKEVLISSLGDYKFSPHTESTNKYKFRCWSKGGFISEGGTEIAEDSTITLENDTVLYANYKIGVYDLLIIYKDADGNKLDEVTVQKDYGSHNTSELDTPSFTSLAFEKWTDDKGADLGVKFMMDGERTIIGHYGSLYNVQVFAQIGAKLVSSEPVKFLSDQKKVLLNDIKNGIREGGRGSLIDNNNLIAWDIYGSDGKVKESLEPSTDSTILTKENYISSISACKILLRFEKKSYSALFGPDQWTTYGSKNDLKDGDIIYSTDIDEFTNKAKAANPDKVFNGWKRSGYSELVDFEKGYEFHHSSEGEGDIYFEPVFDQVSTINFTILNEDYKTRAWFASITDPEDPTKFQRTITITDKEIHKPLDTEIGVVLGRYKLVVSSEGEVGKTWSFDDWYFDPDFTSRFVDWPVTKFLNGKDLYAHFSADKDTVSVLIDRGEGEFEGGDKQIILNPKYEDTIEDLKKLPNYKTPKLNDYVFSCWQVYDASRGEKGEYVDVDDKFKLTGDTYLRPKFVEKIETPTSIANDNWATLCAVAENKIVDSNGNAYASGYDALKDKYSSEYAASTFKLGSTSYSKTPNSFIGIRHKYKMINNNDELTEFEVKVIGENHDNITGETDHKAPLTFMVSKLNTTTAKNYREIYNADTKGGKSNNWGCSPLRKSMLPSGIFNNNIESTLRNHAKFVDKETRYGRNYTDDEHLKCYELETTSDQFFLLSGTELGFTDSKYDYYFNENSEHPVSEGTTYSNFVGLNDDERAKQLKGLGKGESNDFFLRSPFNHKHHYYHVEKKYLGVLGSGVNKVDKDGYLLLDNKYDGSGERTQEYETNRLQAVIFGFAIGE